MTCSITLTVCRHSCCRSRQSYHREPSGPGNSPDRLAGSARARRTDHPRASTEARKLAARVPERGLRFDSERPGHVHQIEEQLAEGGGIGRAARPDGVSGSAVPSIDTASVIRTTSSATSGKHHPHGQRLALQLGHQGQGREGRRDALGHARAVLLRFLDGLPVGRHVLGSIGGPVAEHMGMARRPSLSCTPRATSASVNLPASAPNRAWK